MPTYALVNSWTRANRTTRAVRGVFDGTLLGFMTGWDGGGAASNPEVHSSPDLGVSVVHNSVGAGGASNIHGLVKTGGSFWMMELLTPSVRVSANLTVWGVDSTIGIGAGVGPFVRDGSGTLYGDSDNVASNLIRRRDAPNTWVSLGGMGAAPHRYAVPIPGTSDILIINDVENRVSRFTLETLVVPANPIAAVPIQAAGPTIGAPTATVHYASKVDAINPRVWQSTDSGVSYHDSSLPAPFAGQCHITSVVRGVNQKTYAVAAQGGGAGSGGRPARLCSILDASTLWAIESDTLDPGVGWEMIGAVNFVAGTGLLSSFLLWRNGADFRLYSLTLQTAVAGRNRLPLLGAR